MSESRARGARAGRARARIFFVREIQEYVPGTPAHFVEDQPPAPARLKTKTGRRNRGGAIHDPARLRDFVRRMVSGPTRGDAGRSAFAAGFAKTMHVAKSQGVRLMRDARVRALFDRHLERVDATTDRIVEELARVAFFDVRDAVTWEENVVKFRPSSEIDEVTASAVAGVEERATKYGRELRVRFHDKVAALVALAKVRGMMVHRVQHEGVVGHAVQVYLPQNGREVDVVEATALPPGEPAAPGSSES